LLHLAALHGGSHLAGYTLDTVNCKIHVHRSCASQMFQELLRFLRFGVEKELIEDYGSEFFSTQ
jgi:hypothetical protein